MSDKIRKIEGITKESTQAMIDDALSVYPEKAKKKRAPHLAPNDADLRLRQCQVQQRNRSGCDEARAAPMPAPKVSSGGRSATWCMFHTARSAAGWYSWGTRRNLMSGITGVTSFPMQFTSDFQEKDIVYGGDKKLKVLLEEAHDLFPLAKGISVLSECPVGLIGDDINSLPTVSQGSGNSDYSLQLRGIPRCLPVAWSPHLQRHYPRLHHRDPRVRRTFQPL